MAKRKLPSRLPLAGKPGMASQTMNSYNTKSSERERVLQLTWLCARELVGTKDALAEITELLGDIRRLAQQQTELLRRIVSEEAR